MTNDLVSLIVENKNDDVQDKRSKLDALQNLFGVENNQVLIRKYEIIGADFRHITSAGDGSGFFIEYPHELDDTNTYEYIDIFTLQEYFIHLLKEVKR